MKLVLDTNILFTIFWKGSLIKKLLLSKHELYCPRFALLELEEYKSEILDKTRLTSDEFEEFKDKLQRVIKFVPFSEYSDSIPKALSLLPHHPKDVDFLGLALEIKASILSKDKELKKQSEIVVLDESNIPGLLDNT